ncbi:MAG TPA: PEGA domain-containing protein, partial [Labilithrix sp.]|nr:PEGA domain-containing protein [Labilithrix sp.]
LSMPAAARTVTDLNANRGAKPSAPALGALVAAVLVLASGLGIAGYLIAKNRNDSASQVPAATQTPAIPKGSLVVTSDPPGASIWINGDLRPEVTPATIKELPTGVALDVKLTMDGFEQSKHKATLKDGEPSNISVELKKGSVVVDVKVTPDGVEKPVFALDGKTVTGPRIDGVTSGVSHKLTVNAPGYAEASVTFTGGPLETKQLEVNLEKATEHRHSTPVFAARPATVQPAGRGKLNVGASGGWCNVTVDGAARGATPVAGLELSSGPHKVTCTTPDGKAHDATVTVPAGDTARYKFTL